MNKGIMIFLALGLTACGGGSDAANSSTPNPAPTPVDMKVVSGIGCYKIDAGSGTTLAYSYENSLLDSGDRFVVCSVSGSVYQVSNSHLYKAGSTGASTGTCHVGYDIDAPSSGYWSFTSLGSIATVYYLDAGSAHNNYQYTFTSDCTNF